MRALVTGGGGFVGSGIVRRLVERGADVVSLARGDYPWLRDLGVDARRGDVAERDAVVAAAEGCDVVFHVAAKAGMWGSHEVYRRVNVVGTENVVAACLAAGVPRLVHTSTPSVVHGGHDVEGADESLPYPSSFLTHYQSTKALAERVVLAANRPTLATVALRPHIIWGPGDNQLLPRIVARHRSGRLRRIGRRDPLVDATYIDNVVDAHLAAADRLGPDAACAGRAYFIANDEPVGVWTFIDQVLAAAGLGPVTKSVPRVVAMAAGGLCELVWAALRIEREPPMTRFLAAQLSTAHWFDLSAAKRDLGYAPRVSTTEGLARLAAWCAENPV